MGIVKKGESVKRSIREKHIQYVGNPSGRKVVLELLIDSTVTVSTIVSLPPISTQDCFRNMKMSLVLQPLLPSGSGVGLGEGEGDGEGWGVAVPP